MLTFYNLRVGRSEGQVATEVRHLARTLRPRVLGLCEAVGYALPRLEDYHLVRDASRASRANVAAYVRRDSTVQWSRWRDLHETWSRTETTGTHPPRSILELRLDHLHVLVHHQPPQGTDNTLAAQNEGVDALTDAMTPWRDPKAADWSPKRTARAMDLPRVVLWDSNRRPGERGPGPDRLARQVRGQVFGHHIDNAVTRNLNLRARYTTLGGDLRSDHTWGALVCTVPGWSRW